MVEQIAVYDSFPAAHRIRIDAAGTREPVHIHHWRVRVEFRTADAPEASALAARRWVETWVSRHRGRSLNDVEPFGVVNPTAEEVARHVAEEFRQRFPTFDLRRVTIGEAAGFRASYVPESNARR
jgi:6-pyruvoyl-tetrahydropterin synthase